MAKIFMQSHFSYVLKVGGLSQGLNISSLVILGLKVFWSVAQRPLSCYHFCISCWGNNARYSPYLLYNCLHYSFQSLFSFVGQWCDLWWCFTACRAPAIHWHSMLFSFQINLNIHFTNVYICNNALKIGVSMIESGSITRLLELYFSIYFCIKSNSWAHPMGKWKRQCAVHSHGLVGQKQDWLV